jgi:hypothetical protein
MDGNYTLDTIKKLQLNKKSLAIGPHAAYECHNIDFDIKVKMNDAENKVVDVIVPKDVAKYSEYLCNIAEEFTDINTDAVPVINSAYKKRHMESIIKFYQENSDKLNNRPILRASIPTDEYFNKVFDEYLKNKKVKEVALFESIFNTILTADAFGFESYINAAAHFLFNRSFMKSLTDRKSQLESLFFILPVYADSDNWVTSLYDKSPQLVSILLHYLYDATYEDYTTMFKKVNENLIAK